MNENILELKNIGKTFSGVNVLRNVGLTIRRGEVHAILGENGAGKSTLIKIISGYHQPDAGGEIILDGVKHEFKSPRDSLKASISTIYQELLLCPQMTVAENICLHVQDKFKGIHQQKKGYRKFAAEILERIGHPDIDPGMQVSRLSIAKRQIVEIARALSIDSKVLLMDEPTSSIAQQDADVLFDLIRRLRDQGVAIIYISHRLSEITELCDRVTVLRDGDYIGTLEKSEIDVDRIINMMVGRSIENIYPKHDVKIGEVVLRVSGLTTGKFSDVSFDVHSGEIFGISGLVGAGRTEILDALFGRLPILSGSIELFGKPYIPTDPANAIKAGFAYVTEDRRASGLVLARPVYENVNIIDLRRIRGLRPVKRKLLYRKTEKYKADLDIRLNNIRQIAWTLSGGNQQKVVVAKWLTTEPRIVLFDEPTRGIDVKAKGSIYDLIGSLVDKGIAVIMVSSELPELLTVSDRVLVMCEGEQTVTVNTTETNQEEIMRHSMR